jgi:hypothetical protein
MRTFLSRVLEDALDNGSDPKSYCFVLPNKRSSLFLRQELRTRLIPNSFFPEILSIEEFMENISGFRVIDSVALLFEFYTSYKNVVANHESNSFESFSKWAPILLQDFNELDSAMAEAESILRYIYEAKRIENWNMGEADPSELVQSYISFHKLIPELYKSFENHMNDSKAGYQGFVYKRACELVRKDASRLKSMNYVFAGFNALSKSEEFVIQHLLDLGNASVYWDDDNFYEKSEASAGDFIKNYRKRWPFYENHTFKWTDDKINTTKVIHLHGLPKNISQIKHAGEILKTLSDKGCLSDTALVLGNEKLLPGLLNSLPPEVPEANITMGYELQNVSLSSFFESLFKVHLNLSARRNKGGYYYKDLQRIFADPQIKKHYLSDPVFRDNWRQLLYKEKRLFISEKEIMGLLGETSPLTDLFKLLFQSWNAEINELLRRLCQITEWFRAQNDPNRMETEILYRFNTIFKQLLNFNDKYAHVNSLEALHEFYRQLLRMEKMSFQGEPLSGLQIMGLLESRVLDFENVIVTSVNEGFLPASRSDRSFIPLDIKFEKHLPTFREKEAIFSYHFFRLLHRAKNIYLVYNSVNDDFGSGEPSRFIKQLEIASKLGMLDNVTLEKISIQPDPIRHPIELKNVRKTKEVFSKMHRIAKRGFSPTAFTTYIRNPMDYYKRYILGIQEVEKVEETMAANTFGTVVHNTLDLLYRPYLGKWLEPDNIQGMLKKVDENVRSQWAEVYSSKAALTGKNYLSFEIAKKFITEFLIKERESLQQGMKIKILGLEEEISCQHQPSGLDFEVRLKGTIDRIDEVNGVLRIVDYKTGKVKPADMKISNWEMLVSDDKYSKAFQVLMYAYVYLKKDSSRNLYADNINDLIALESGIISFKNLRSGFMKFNDQQLTREILDTFVLQLDLLLTELFDSEVPFQEKELQTYPF